MANSDDDWEGQSSFFQFHKRILILLEHGANIKFRQVRYGENEAGNKRDNDLFHFSSFLSHPASLNCMESDNIQISLYVVLNCYLKYPKFMRNIFKTKASKDE